MESKDLNRLKVVLAEKKRTGKWLAQEMNVTQSSVSRWCSNKAQPDLPTLARIAELLKVDLHSLINNVNE